MSLSVVRHLAQGRPDHGFPGSRDVYARITAEIVAAIEAGADDYSMPWHHDGAATARPINVASGKRYRGVNVLALWVAAHSPGYPTGLWGTYRQWRELGAQVRKGERSTTVVFWKQIGSAYSEDKQDDAVDERPRFLARGYPVFNQAQVDGYVAEPARQLPEAERIACAEAFYANLGIATLHGGDEAFYRPSTDTVHMPPFGTFKEGAAYYSVLYHEGVHATAAPHRLDRDLSSRFGSEAYAMEEVVADSGSCMLLADLGIAARPRPDHAAYIASWLKVLRTTHRRSSPRPARPRRPPIGCTPSNRKPRSLRPPDDGGDGGVLLPSRLRRLARGQPLLGRARPVQKGEVLARERPLLPYMPSGVFAELRDERLEIATLAARSLPRPGAAAAAAISSRMSRWVV